MIDLDELRVPRALRLVADEIVAITDAACRAVLDEEYADLARRAVAKLARKRPSPLTAGRRATWAAGVVYALGQANFVFDPASEPYVTADELSEAFGVAKSTMGSKARQVRDLLRISPFSPEFQRADVAAQNPLMWIIEVNGLAVDARHVPVDIQFEAFERGFIPYVPALGRDVTAACEESRVAATAGGEAPSEVASLLERCSELKRQLVEFACSPRFSGQLDQALKEHATGPAASEADVTNVVDHFILQQPLADGRTVAEVLSLRSIPISPMTTARCCKAGARWWPASLRSVSRPGTRSPPPASVMTGPTGSGPTPGLQSLAPMRPGCFMTARIVPVGDDWMLSGAQQLYAASERPAMLRLAAELATGHPRARTSTK